MADVNEELLKALDGPAPQHIEKDTKKPELSYGSNNAIHSKIVDQNGVPFEKVPTTDADTQAKIDALNAKVDAIIDGTTPATTKLSGSIVEQDHLNVYQKKSNVKNYNLLQGYTNPDPLTSSIVLHTETGAEYSHLRCAVNTDDKSVAKIWYRTADLESQLQYVSARLMDKIYMTINDAGGLTLYTDRMPLVGKWLELYVENTSETNTLTINRMGVEFLK